MADNNDTTDQVDGFAPNNERETDPMLAALKEAEEDDNGSGEGDEGSTTVETPAAPAAAQPAADKGPKAPPVMIPKARLDEVIAERDGLRDANSYLQGVLDTRTQQSQQQPAAPGKDTPANPPESTPDFKTQIASARSEKIALAQQYEDGEISLVEFKTKENALDEKIEELRDARNQDQLKEVRTAATETVKQNNVQQYLESEGAKIQAENPYVKEIDKLPPAIRDGVWQEIANKAALNLAKKGINPEDGTPASKLAFIREKAALTNEYGPRYTGVKLDQPAKTVSQTAADRGKKLDIAAQQPPAIEGANMGERPELTEADLEGMTQDQIADAYAANPHLVNKAAGLKAK